MFVMMGAAVDIPYKVHKLLGNLGPKLYFWRMPKTNKSKESYKDQLKKNDFVERRYKVQAALHEYLRWFEICPAMSEKDGLPKIEWHSDKDDDVAIGYIVELAILLKHLRGVVITYESKDTQGSDYAYALPKLEEPDRAMVQLKNLGRGHALSQGRNYITMDDLPII
jgi:hypothetical protein